MRDNEKEVFAETHRTHCCIHHGCKYGEKTCPIVLKKFLQESPCERCGDEEPQGQEREEEQPASEHVCLSCRRITKKPSYCRLCANCTAHQERVVDAIVKHCRARGMFTTAETIEQAEWVRFATWLEEKDDNKKNG